MAVTLPMAATAATSALCSVAIVASYCVFPTLRLDPATQLMWWSLVDGLAALIFFAQYVQPADECAGYAFATQLLMLTSQAFFATFAIDLVHTLRQPFDRVSNSAYVLVALSVGLSSAILLDWADVYGVSIFGFCWVRKMGQGEGFNWWLWGLFYIPTSVCFVIAWYASLFGAVRLRRGGLPRSFAARERSTNALQLVVRVNFTFFCACGLGYVADLRYAHGSLPWLTQLVYSAFTGKGIINVLLWWQIQANSLFKKARGKAKDERRHGLSGELELSSRNRSFWLHSIDMNGNNSAGSLALESGGTSVPPTAEHEEEELAHALRQEVLEVTLKGIRTGVRRTADAMEGGASLHTSDQYAVLGGGIDVFPFYDYRPQSFARLRALAGVDSSSYLHSLSERLIPRNSPGGKSGAFLYTTADNKYLLKTCTASECTTLVRVLDSYMAYLAESPKTLICRFVGCHAIEMYSKRVHFVVMTNVFGELPTKPNVTYDLKGSYVGRSKSKKQASVRLDNDLAHTLWLEPEMARLLASQLKSDADWLTCSGLLDYSLIVGLVNRRFYPALPRPSASVLCARNTEGGGADRQRASGRPGADSQRASGQSVADSQAGGQAGVDSHGGGSGQSGADSQSHPAISPALNSSREYSQNYSEFPEVGSLTQAGGQSGTDSQGLSGQPGADSHEGGSKQSGAGSQGQPVQLAKQYSQYSNDSEILEVGSLAQIPAAIVEGPGLFASGIIDILQSWTLRKRVEYFVKTYILLKDPRGFSAVRPKDYGERFVANVVMKLIGQQADVTAALVAQNASASELAGGLNTDSESEKEAGLWFDACEVGDGYAAGDGYTGNCGYGGIGSHAQEGTTDGLELARLPSSLRQKRPLSRKGSFAIESLRVPLQPEAVAASGVMAWAATSIGRAFGSSRGSGVAAVTSGSSSAKPSAIERARSGRLSLAV